MIDFMFTNGQMCPIVNCDHCGERMRFKDGIAGCRDHEKTALVCVHKIKCDMAWQKKNGELIYWQPLEEFLVHLTFNAADEVPNPLASLPDVRRAELNEWRELRCRLAPIVFRRDGHKCVYCGSNQRLTVDHIQPLSKGGSHSLVNLATACRSCNSSKSAKTPEEWQQ